MPVSSDKTLKQLNTNLIDPFIPEQVRDNVISYGLSSYGYDIRISNEFKVLTKTDGIIDPKNFDDSIFEDYTVDSHITIPANNFVLGRSVEYIRMPRDTVGLVLGKSSLARSALLINVTPLEPEWEGYITIEISNTSKLDAIVYANEGIGQILFLQGDQPCEVSYADRKGKYQRQVGVVTPRL